MSIFKYITKPDKYYGIELKSLDKWVLKVMRFPYFSKRQEETHVVTLIDTLLMRGNTYIFMEYKGKIAHYDLYPQTHSHLNHRNIGTICMLKKSYYMQMANVY